MDLQILEAQISGLTAKLKELRDHEALFLRAGGLDEAAERALSDKVTAERKIAIVKQELADLQAKKAQSLKATTEALSTKMSEVLPAGRGIFEITDDELFIGWEKPDGTRTPHLALSGGERVFFDLALSNALLGDGEKILINEAAELDDDRLLETLKHLKSSLPEDVQAIVNTCHAPKGTLEGWTVLEIGGAA